MEIDWTTVFYIMLLIDSMGAIVMSWFGQKWWISVSGAFGKHFPPAKGWSVLYFILVLMLGYTIGLF